MPEAYGGVIVDYCLGQTLNANQVEELAKWNAERRNQGAGARKHISLFYKSHTLNVKCVCASACVCVCVVASKKVTFEPTYSHINPLIHRTESLTPNVSQGEKIPHGEQDMLLLPGCHAQWVLWLILCPDVKLVGGRASSPLKLL